MAKSRLSQATYVTHGYGQVEPNHLSAQRTAQIYAQLPAKKNIEVLENGQFVKYDYANGEVNFTGAGEWMLVFNEVKLYRDNEQYDDFAMTKEGTTMVPRVFKTNVGDIFTTNCVNLTLSDEATTLMGKVLSPNENGILSEAQDEESTETMKWQVVKVYTLADRQKAVKVMRIA